MSRTHDRIVILGLGLIGGSLARSLRSTGFCREITGWGHRDASLRRGVELGIIDNYSLDLEEAIADADVIVVATPTLVAADMLRQLLPLLPRDGSGPVVTDVASERATWQQLEFHRVLSASTAHRARPSTRRNHPARFLRE